MKQHQEHVTGSGALQLERRITRLNSVLFPVLTRKGKVRSRKHVLALIAGVNSKVNGQVNEQGSKSWLVVPERVCEFVEPKIFKSIDGVATEVLRLVSAVSSMLCVKNCGHA